MASSAAPAAETTPLLLAAGRSRSLEGTSGRTTLGVGGLPIAAARAIVASKKLKTTSSSAQKCSRGSSRP